jgi:hypothetical protein
MRAISDQRPDDDLVVYSTEEMVTCMTLIAEALNGVDTAFVPELLNEIQRASAMIARTKNAKLPLTPITYHSAGQLIEAIGVYVSDLAVRAHEIKEKRSAADCIFARDLVASIHKLSVNMALMLQVLPS